MGRPDAYLATPPTSPKARRWANGLWLGALAVDLVFVLQAAWMIIYVLPKRPSALFGRWQYHNEYDNLTLGVLMVWPIAALLLREFAAALSKRRRFLLIVLILSAELLAATTLIPVRSKSRELANRTRCASLLGQIGQAIESYARRGNGPLPSEFADLLGQPGVSPQIFACPSADSEVATGQTLAALTEDFAKPRRCSYVYLGAGRTLLLPARFILAHEPPANHDGDGMHVLYADWSVVWLGQKEAAHVSAELAAGHNPPRPTSVTRPAGP